ncbi:protein tramtrack, alpha isoform isoform X1 [Drosophila yakuba]|uniref:Tramtrack, isoform A n=1 Tax=Drosophila yakuba TaxID=7245 RepID=B4PP11_DROYA|nr:protein tramtrack, alpha isoform isoform X1 [Drosophila yakuba]XP_015049173.1 protein tramtrack, alpha isoform isoform X1 [Drosophila yakuba]XP_015049176.1 protein tramtrack, alpha isoform isoform X1 [Drosophila yakuba]XP_039231845.1 protein tramtrack, alpha isoform isoform X1 [Drosophila yakuba]EDW99247.1 tramtrack, isoform A [Drosophila yakuba]KRK04745.1 tramtrack, isoform B [Drosophila yakuba]KRK04748.1 tramtrack, isoform E [Drosophila yakuba]
MKMASQRFCLRWNNHQSNLLSVFDQLLHAETFTDVTLAVEGQYLKAHKMVLSACSPYFNALFVNHPEKHPIVILKDVPYSDMKSLLDFMYRGEVSVDQERLTAFLRVAESLRIKGLTEVNDDKPSPAAAATGAGAVGSESTPTPPQLQRIQPYLVPQRNRSQAGGLLASAANAGNTPTLPVQPSLLSSALMPKRKRGRPRKLSGSSNGTGNDYDDFDRENMMNDSSDLGNGKLGNESYSGNDDGSDDNQPTAGHTDDLNESRDSLPSKRSKNSKDHRVVSQHEDNSTSVTPTKATPELSQRLFGSSSTTISTAASGGGGTALSEPISLLEISDERDSAPVHLPTILGLKIRAVNTTTPTQQGSPQTPTKSKPKMKQVTGGNNSNSLLKQQLRGGAKDPEVPAAPRLTVAVAPNAILNVEDQSKEIPKKNQDEVNACLGLHSLANAAEQQAAQVASSGNLHHQLLLHMAANNSMLNTTDYYQQQQQESPSSAGQFMDDDMDLLSLNEQQIKGDEPDHEMVTLADENAGLPGYQGHEAEATPKQEGSPAPETPTAPPPTPRSGKKGAKRPIQRRRVRRKAQSTLDDQAEHLTEMSVRGLDLFRYASVVEGVYRCTECAKENMQKTFKNKYSFQRHAFLYHEGKHRKVFPCPVCSKEFSRPDKMKNHLKMTHENFTPPKDIGAFSPLKYLISAAAAGDMHATIYQQQQDHYHRQLAEQLEQQNASFDSRDSSLILPDVKMEHAEDQDADQEAELSDGGYDASNPAAAAAAMLSLQHDVIIKDEIQISPSPSPTPPASCAVAEGKSLALASTAQTAT